MTASALAQRLEDRLGKAFLENCLRVETSDRFRVQERDNLNDGAADVELALPTPLLCLHFAAEERGGTRFFQFLRGQPCADGALLVPIAEGRMAAHIVECKRTLKPDKWQQVKGQFTGALYRLRALSQVLEIQIDQVTCYTAWRELELVRPSPANTVQRRVATGQRATTPNAEETDHAQGMADLGVPFGRLPHRDIRLSVEQRDGHEVGCARVALTAA